MRPSAEQHSMVGSQRPCVEEASWASAQTLECQLPAVKVRGTRVQHKPKEFAELPSALRCGQAAAHNALLNVLLMCKNACSSSKRPALSVRGRGRTAA